MAAVDRGIVSMSMMLAGNPKSFLNGKKNVTMGEPYVADAKSSGWLTEPHADQVQFGGTRAFDAGFQDATSKVTVAPAPNGAKSPVRFLPFQPDKVTCMKIDPTASVAFTSQLSGCNIYVSSIGGDVWMFHANANDNSADAASNDVAKRRMAEAARNRLGGNRWDLMLERNGGQAFYKPGNAIGVFFGQKVIGVGGGSGWGFYLCTPDGLIHRLASSVAATNATA
jgi:hypothetical protein